jgi:hypothetical protein
MKKENNISDVEKQHALMGVSPMTEADILRTAAFSQTAFFK